MLGNRNSRTVREGRINLSQPWPSSSAAIAAVRDGPCERVGGRALVSRHEGLGQGQLATDLSLERRSQIPAQAGTHQEHHEDDEQPHDAEEAGEQVVMNPQAHVLHAMGHGAPGHRPKCRLFLPLGHFETIPETPDGLNPVSHIAQLGPQSPDVHVHSARLDSIRDS